MFGKAGYAKSREAASGTAQEMRIDSEVRTAVEQALRLMDQEHARIRAAALASHGVEGPELSSTEDLAL